MHGSFRPNKKNRLIRAHNFSGEMTDTLRHAKARVRDGARTS